MKEITVVTTNEVGTLAKICEILGNSGINIQSISAHSTEDKGIIKIITSDPESANNFLSKRGYNPVTNDIVVVKLMDRPGEMGKLTKRIAHAGVNLESVYYLSKSNGYADVALVPEKKADINMIKDAVGKEQII